MRYSQVYERNRDRADTPKDTLLNVEQVASRLNCSRRHVYSLIDEGHITGFNVGKTRGKRVFSSSVDHYLSKKALEAA
jgi:excisionase family DNA binding protein